MSYKNSQCSKETYDISHIAKETSEPVVVTLSDERRSMLYKRNKYFYKIKGEKRSKPATGDYIAKHIPSEDLKSVYIPKGKTLDLGFIKSVYASKMYIVIKKDATHEILNGATIRRRMDEGFEPVLVCKFGNVPCYVIIPSEGNPG